MPDRFNFSILIPTLNAGALWPDVLKSVDRQILKPGRKIIIDSGSTDTTVEQALEHGFEVYHIDKNDFNHGRVRQQLANMATNTEVLVFLTQDAIVAENNSIDNLVMAFSDPGVGLAYGRQLPHQNASVVEAHARLFNYPAQSQVRSGEDKARLGFKVFFCSNSFSAYRSTALADVGGFPSDSIMGEDAIVAAKMLMKGLKIAYVAEATVHHSHSYTIKAEFKRYFDTRVFHEQNKWLIKEYGKPTGEGLKFVKSELHYVAKNDLRYIFKSLASIWAKWLGYKSGRYYKKLSVKTLKKLSMHSYYWKDK